MTYRSISTEASLISYTAFYLQILCIYKSLSILIWSVDKQTVSSALRHILLEPGSEFTRVNLCGWKVKLEDRSSLSGVLMLSKTKTYTLRMNREAFLHLLLEEARKPGVRLSMNRSLLISSKRAVL